MLIHHHHPLSWCARYNNFSLNIPIRHPIRSCAISYTESCMIVLFLISLFHIVLLYSRSFMYTYTQYAFRFHFILVPVCVPFSERIASIHVKNNAYQRMMSRTVKYTHQHIHLNRLCVHEFLMRSLLI